MAEADPMTMPQQDTPAPTAKSMRGWTKMLVMFGVLGGLAAFGMVGLFLGPVILAVMVAVWREWLESANTPVPRDGSATDE